MTTAFVPRSQINQVFQIGSEVTPNVGGTARNRLGTFNSQIAPVSAGAFGVFRPAGGKYVGQIVPGDTYSEGAVTDTIDYNTIPFLFAGNVGYLAPTAGGGAEALALTYRHTPSPFSLGTQKTYVVQEGMTGAVYNYRNVIIPDLNLRFMRTGASQVGGRILGKKFGAGTALTTATQRTGRSINSIKTGIWTAASWTLLDTAAVRIDPYVLDLSWRHNGVFAPWFALDDSEVSFSGTLEEAADAGVQVTIMADVNGAGTDMAGPFTMAAMENGTKIYLSVINMGGIIPGCVTSQYSLEIMMCLQISGPPRRTNVGSLRAWQWDCIMVPDSEAPNLPFDITVVCDLPVAAFGTA